MGLLVCFGLVMTGAGGCGIFPVTCETKKNPGVPFYEFKAVHGH